MSVASENSCREGPGGRKRDEAMSASAKAAEPRVIPSDPQMHKMAELLGRSLMKPVSKKQKKQSRKGKQ